MRSCSAAGRPDLPGALFIAAALAVSVAIILSGCAAGGPPTTSANPGQAPAAPKGAVAAQKPVPAEKSPPGDIPDNQQYVIYKAAAAKAQVKVPEGWSLTQGASMVAFTDKLNTIELSFRPAKSVPTLATAKSTDAGALARTEAAFRLVGVKEVSLPGGKAVLISYEKNSDKNPVTGKQYRLDALRYEFFARGEQATVTLLSPVGADNVDPWRIVTGSFKWTG